MFMLRRRANSNSTLATVGIEDATSVDLSGASEAGVSCSTPGSRRRRTDQALSDKRPASESRQSPRRSLSENEKARISIYLQILNAVVAAVFAASYAAKDQSIILFQFIRAQGLKDLVYLSAAVTVTGVLVTASLALYAVVLLHQSLVSVFSPFLLVNATFFTLHPHPPPSPSFRSVRRSLSKTELPSLPLDKNTSKDATQKSPYGDARPLIDLSARSSEAGDTPPARSVLLPEVLSPTQLQLRSLSPAFDASMQQVKERDIAEIMQTTTSTMPASLGAMLAKRNDTGPLMYGRLTSAERSMSTVSYPDIYGSTGESDEEADGQYKLMQDTIYESEQEEEEEQDSSVNPANIDTDADFDDEEEGDSLQFPLPNVQPEDIPFTYSPTHLAFAVGPEVIDVLDPESRQATMDAAVPTGMAMPVPHTGSVALEQASLSVTPPPSRIATMAQATNEAVDSPRDIFSPTPVAFPQPMNGLPFAFPFLREQLQQRLASPPAASISQWNHNVVESAEKKEDADDHITEPTPYPSPPFTPPSSRPPTIYSSMALQIPPRDLAPEMLTTPDPFVVERSPLSALAEESKPEMEVEAALPVSHTVAEPDIKEPDVPVTEEYNQTLYEPTSLTAEVEQVQNSPGYPKVAPSLFDEIIMPTARQGILRNPLSYVQQVENTPPRTISPVKSIGRGGLLDGSRIPVDDLPVESPVASTADVDHTLVASAPEEALNEVGTVIEQDPEYTGGDELHPIRQFSGANSGADDESTAPRAKTDLKKRRKKTKKTKKGVSFDEVPFVIGSDLEREDDGTDTVLNDVASPALSTSPLAAAPIPIPKTFEIEEEEEVIPELISPNVSSEAMMGSPIPFRSASLMSELMSPRSTADEMSDSSSAILPPGQFSDKQVDHYGRWFARAHRDKALPTIQALRDQMKACTDIELAGRLRLGSRADPTKLSKSLVGEDNMKGVGAQGSLPPPPIRKGSSYRRRR